MYDGVVQLLCHVPKVTKNIYTQKKTAIVQQGLLQLKYHALQQIAIEMFLWMYAQMKIEQPSVRPWSRYWNGEGKRNNGEVWKLFS